MIQTFGLSHIQIAIRDLEKSVRFYLEIFGTKKLFRVGATCMMLQTPVSQEEFTLNGRPDSQKEAEELTAVQHFGLCQQRHREQQPQLIGSGNDK